MEGLVEPLPRDLRAALRRAALDHALSRAAPALHTRPARRHPGRPAGRPGARAATCDWTTRCAPTWWPPCCVRAARRAGRDRLVWLTRPGDLELQDVDAAWLAAARAASAEAGTPLDLRGGDRHGWRDPRSGLGRTWTRLRRR